MEQGRQRADAFASVNRIVVAARAVLAEGASATLAQVARRAGVGSATLYRHFPNRQALAAVVYEDVFSSEIEPLFAQFHHGDAPRAELLEVTERIADVVQQHRELISSLDNLTEITAALLSRNDAAFVAMIRRAQEAGNLRRDISADDIPNVLAMVASALTAVNLDKVTRRRYLSLLLDGLNPENATPLPGTPPRDTNGPLTFTNSSVARSIATVDHTPTCTGAVSVPQESSVGTAHRR